MLNLPVIRLDIEGLKQSVASVINVNNEDLQKYVAQRLEEEIKEDWVLSEINEAVTLCIENSIKRISDDYRLQTAISNIIAKSIADLIDPQGE